MQLVADRFVVDDRGHAIDLASGDRVQLSWSSAGGASEQVRWAARCALFASLHHPSIARLVDYGGCGETRRFEAWRASGALSATDAAARQVMVRANRFLSALSLTAVSVEAPAALDDGRVVAVLDAEAGLPIDGSETLSVGDDLEPALLGIVREPDRRVSGVVDIFSSRSAPRTVALCIWGRQGSGIGDAVSALARAARLAGLVPVCTRALTSDVRTVVQGRSLLVIATDAVDAGWRAVLDSSLATPRAHVVLFAGATTVPRVYTIPLQHIPDTVLTGSVRPAPCSSAVARHVADAARRARGNPGAFERLLWGVGGDERRVTLPAFHVAEQVASFGADAHAGPGDAQTSPRVRQWPALADLAKLRRQLDLARDALSRGRLAAGERIARQTTAALARRGDPASAAAGAVSLAEALARHGRSVDAQRVLADARTWASGAGDTRLLRSASIVTGRVLTDLGRLSDAQVLLEAALASASSDDAPDRVMSACALARCLYWQGRYDEAWQQLALHTTGLLTDREAIKVAVVRSRLAIGRGRITDAIAEAARARDAARSLNAADLIAASCYGWALAQLAAGDCTLAGAAAADASAAARQARRPQLSLCARLLRGEITRRQGALRPAATLVARLGRLPATRLPPVVRARVDLLRDGCSGADLADAARKRALLTGFQALSLLAPTAARQPATVAVDAIAELLQCCQAAEEDTAVLAGLCARLRARLRATVVACLASEQEHFVQIAGEGGKLEPAIASRVAAAGQLVMPHHGADRVEAGAPVRYAGRVVGVLAARWPPAAIWDADAVSLLLSTGAAAAGPALSGAAARRARAAVPRGSDLLGVSAAIREVRDGIERAAGAPFPVLVLGESGSGKELVARLLHRLGPRRDRAFCALNCAALPDELAESELFGHARGAFTGAHGDRQGVFEEAHGGTLLLDEVGELSLRAQAKVLRTIQEGEVRRVGENTCRRVDVRLIAATNRDLRAEAAAGRFRMDLLYRLDVIRILLPPLRERRDDIVVLADHFWREATGRIGSRAALAATTVAALARYDWPGNIRELQNVLAALAVRTPRRGVVMPSALPSHLGLGAAECPVGLEAARRAFDRRFIGEALSRAGGHRARAAEELGISRQGLAKLMSRLRIDDEASDTEES